MKRFQTRYATSAPRRRPLKIFAIDPMVGREQGNRTTIEVANERLRPGPRGRRVEVVDFDGAHRQYFQPVDLDEPTLLMSGGLEPNESDPRFHQQMVYAVAMRTLGNFDQALGRVVSTSTSRHPRLRLIPHGFHGANAFFDHQLHAVVFGYFQADRNNPGRNLPAQNVFTCLSHDIIAHEVTHALVHRLRRHFVEPSNVDVPAFHEAFADIVALFQHFSFDQLLRQSIQSQGQAVREKRLLADLARQFGYATGSGRALRSGLDDPERKLYRQVTEPHARGSVLVAAVFDSFFQTYQRRIEDLLRIATGGTGTLPTGSLHPDLVSRIADEVSRSAESILRMCIRAFDYLPPVDITFGDFLRALVTADYELNPDDRYDQRSLLIEAFRMREIYPVGVVSLAEESLLWNSPEEGMPPVELENIEGMLQQLLLAASEFSEEPAVSGPTQQKSRYEKQGPQDADQEMPPSIFAALHAYARANCGPLYLDPNLDIQVAGFHSAYRVGRGGELLIELIAQFTQRDDSPREELGGLPLRGGTTIVAAADGRIRYVIAKPLPSAVKGRGGEIELRAEQRLADQRGYVEHLDMTDPAMPYYGAAFPTRMLARMGFRSLHQGGLQ